MKTTKLILGLIFICSFCYGQREKMNEKRAIKEKYIDFKKEYIFFEIKGLIEIDGHVFKNDTCKCPIIFKATINGVTIFNECNKTEYVHRKCGKKDCPILHLKKKEPVIIEQEEPFQWWYKNDPGIYLDNNTPLFQPGIYLNNI